MQKKLQRNSLRALFIVLCLCLPLFLWNTLQQLFRGNERLDHYFTVDFGNDVIIQFDQCEYFFYILFPILFFLIFYLFIVKGNIFLQKSSGASTQNRIIGTVLGAFIVWYLLSSFFTTLCYCIMPLFLPTGSQGYVMGSDWIAIIGDFDPIFRAFSSLRSVVLATGKELLKSNAYATLWEVSAAWCTYYLPSYTFMLLCVVFHQKGGKHLFRPLKKQSFRVYA